MDTSLVPLNQQPGACTWCSTPTSATFHAGACPRVKAIEYHPDGSVKRIEFHAEQGMTVTSNPTGNQWLGR